MEPQLHRQVGGPGRSEDRERQTWADTSYALVDEVSVLILGGSHATESASEGNPDAIPQICRAYPDAGVIPCLEAGRDSKLGETIESPRALGRCPAHEGYLIDLRSDPRSERTRIKAGDVSNGRSAG